MIDRYKITWFWLQMDDQAIEDPQGFAAKYSISDYQVFPSYNERKKRRTAVIHWLPNKSLDFYVEEIDGKWVARSATGTAAALLFGHNGHPITTDAEFTAFLGRFWDLASKLIHPRDHHRIIPGMSKESDAFWSSLEVHVQVPDPDGSLFRAFQNMRHRGIRKKASHYAGETVSLVGKERKFQVYRKDLQMRSELDKFGGQSGPVLRFEMRLQQKTLPAAFSDSNLRLFGETKRLVSFTLGDLETAFRNFTADIEGVFLATGDTPVTEAIPRFLAGIAAEHNLNVSDLVQKYATEKSLSKARAATLWKESLRHLQTLVAVDPVTLFSHEACINQPAIEVPGLETALDGMVGRYAYTNPQITRVYTVQPQHFVPAPNIQ